MIPLPIFQTIMIDYDLVFVDNDRDELSAESYIMVDKEKNELVDYQKIFRDFNPKQMTMNIANLAMYAIKI